MRRMHRYGFLIVAAGLCTGNAVASELSYTFLDFQYITQDTSLTGSQFDANINQQVDVVTKSGDGVSASGSLAIGSRFYANGSFSSAIVDVDGVVTNPLGITDVADTFDLIFTRLAFGYQYELGSNFDILGEISYDSHDLDFGSFAGENFDISESGYGAAIGFRWNPMPPLEISLLARNSSVGKVNLDTLEFDSDTGASISLIWYFIEDLGVGFRYEDADVKTATISMRFSFGTLPW